jgi:hypothetical protein
MDAGCPARSGRGFHGIAVTVGYPRARIGAIPTEPALDIGDESVRFADINALRVESRFVAHFSNSHFGGPGPFD